MKIEYLDIIFQKLDSQQLKLIIQSPLEKLFKIIISDDSILLPFFTSVGKHNTNKKYKTLFHFLLFHEKLIDQ